MQVPGGEATDGDGRDAYAEGTGPSGQTDCRKLAYTTCLRKLPLPTQSFRHIRCMGRRISGQRTKAQDRRGVAGRIGFSNGAQSAGFDDNALGEKIS